MCVLFPTEVDVKSTVIRDVRIDQHTRELMYSNKITTSTVTKPVLMMFNISGPIVDFSTESEKLRYDTVSTVNSKFKPLEVRATFESHVDFHRSVVFSTEFYAVTCRTKEDLIENFADILKELGYNDFKNIEEYRTRCLPALQNGHVALCVLQPGFEKGDDQMLCFKYTPADDRVIVPLSHELNEDGVYDYNVLVHLDGVEGDYLQFKEIVNSLKLNSVIPRQGEGASYLYDTVTNDNKRAIYKIKEYKWRGEHVKYFPNGFIYNLDTKELYIKLDNVSSSLNKNVVLTSALY